MMLKQNYLTHETVLIKPITESVQQRLPFQDVTNKPSSSSNKLHNNKVNSKNKDTDSNNCIGKNKDKHCDKIKSHIISTKKHCKYRKFSSFAAKMASRWPARRLEYTADVIVDALKEKGSDSWTVDCSCGAKDDDGERMVACHICEVWQHTRCSGINDADAVPRLFLSANCNASLMPSTEQYYMEEEPESMLEQVYSGGYMES